MLSTCRTAESYEDGLFIGAMMVLELSFKSQMFKLSCCCCISEDVLPLLNQTTTRSCLHKYSLYKQLGVTVNLLSPRCEMAV